MNEPHQYPLSYLACPACDRAALCPACAIAQDDDYDPTPWCIGCGAHFKSDCDCGPLAENE